MKFLTKEQIDGLPYSACQKQLRQIAKNYNLNEPLIGNPKFEAVWEQLEDICNNLLWLEDRISQYENARFSLLKIEETVE